MRISDWSSDVCSSDLESSSDGCRTTARLAPPSEEVHDSVPETPLAVPVGRVHVGQRVDEYDEARRIELQAMKVGLPAALSVDDVRHDTVHLLAVLGDRQSTPLNYRHSCAPRMPPYA